MTSQPGGEHDGTATSPMSRPEPPADAPRGSTRTERLVQGAMRGVNRATRTVGLSVLRSSSLERFRTAHDAVGADAATGPPGGLQPPDGWARREESPSIVDPRRLHELEQAYQQHPVTRLGGHWDTDHTRGVSLSAFRGDNAFVWQRRLYDTQNYLATIVYLRAHDDHGLLDLLDEDGAFGAEVLTVSGRRYSRDLLDSVNEISFLLDELPSEALTPLRLVDVGAGYGRLAHRLAAARPDSELYCVDGIAVSTAVCDAYLRYRGLESRVAVVPLTQLDAVPMTVSVATNIHSFSEMSYEAVDWWLGWLAQLGVEFLFLVPNSADPALIDGRSFRDRLDAHGFQQWKKRRKYTDPVVDEYGVYPGTYYLFRRA